MSSSKPPPAPDYAGAAEKTSQGAIQNTEQQTWANRSNQYTPFGATTWQNTPTWDPTTGQWINQWTQNTSLAPDLQAAANSQMAIAAGRSAMGEQLLAGAGSQLLNGGTPWQNVPAAGQSLQGNQIKSGFQGAGPALPTGAPQAGSLQTGIQSAGGLTRSVPQTGAQANVAGGGPIVNSFDSGMGLTNQYSPGFAVQQQMYQNMGPEMGGPIDPRTGQVNTNYQGLGAGEAARNAATDAIYQQAVSRLDPQWQRRMEGSRADLYNMGLREGDAGYAEQTGELNRNMNDAYNQAMWSAIQAGGAEQQRQFGMNLGAAQFGNQAVGQQYNQALGAAQFQQGLNQQGYNQALGASQFANNAQAQQNQQNLQAAQFQNAAGGQSYAQNLGAAQFGNQAAQQQFAQNLAQQQAYNAAQQQIFGQGLAAGQFGNAAQAQQFQQNAAQQQAYNQALAQQFQMGLAGTQQNAALNQQGFSQAQQQAAFANQAAAQDLQQQQQISAYQNQLRQQAINEQLMGQGWNLNLINAALAGQQVGLPGMPNYNQAGVAAPPNYLGAAQMQGQYGLDAYSAQQAAQQSLLSGIGSLAGAAAGAIPFAFSDIRLKNNVIRYNEVQLIPGVPLATWEWKGQPGYRVAGVIAQDLEKVAPQFVRTHPNGYKMVNYGFLNRTRRKAR